MKPLGRKNYGSIGHLPSSRMGPADHHVHEGQARICTMKARDRHDVIVVEEKLDGSNVGIANVEGRIVALGRAGYLAQTSKYEMHQLFAAWVREREVKFETMLQPGQRLVGEWLAQAHGTRYTLPSGPFVAFDVMEGEKRWTVQQRDRLCLMHDVPLPKLLHVGGPLSVERAMELHGLGSHGAEEPEGVMYRVERHGEVDFLAKWVRPDKIDGKYLPDVTGSVSRVPVWNWRPEKVEG